MGPVTETLLILILSFLPSKHLASLLFEVLAESIREKLILVQR